MADISTPQRKSTKHTLEQTANCENMPKKSTLAFLRQFARCYKIEPRLSPAIGSMIVN